MRSNRISRFFKVMLFAGIAASAHPASAAETCAQAQAKLAKLTRVWQLSLLSTSAETREGALALLGRYLPDLNVSSETSDALAAVNKLVASACADASRDRPFAVKRSDNTSVGLAAFIKELEENLTTSVDEPWCDAGLTWCRKRHRGWFNGLRFIAEPQLGNVLQTGKNRLETDGFGSLPLIGFATDLRDRFLGLQVHIVLPTDVKYDADSAIVQMPSGLNNADRKAHVDFGTGVALTLFDGAIAIGWNFMNLADRDFKNPRSALNPNGDRTHKNSVFIAVQPVAATRAAINAIKK